MSESKVECPFCGRWPGDTHEESCSRYGPNRNWTWIERITLPDKIRNEDKVRLYHLVKFLIHL